MNHVAHRKQQIARRQKQRRRKSSFPIVASVLIMLILAISIYIAAQQQQPDAETTTEYIQADVARQGSFIAQHEMGDGPPILFLPAGDPQPKIVVPTTTHNFGRIGPQDVVERTFIVRNDGEAPLTISRAYTTCGCTTAEFSANVIPPGKLATVNVIFDAGFHDTAGQTVRRGIIIENNDPSLSQAEIWVQATVNRQ